jgi:hypothetical protein
VVLLDFDNPRSGGKNGNGRTQPKALFVFWVSSYSATALTACGQAAALFAWLGNGRRGIGGFICLVG